MQGEIDNSGSIVVHFRHGRAERLEQVPQIDEQRQVVTITGDQGEPEEIPFSELKGIFFLRRTTGEEPPEPVGGPRLAVEFSDGEVIRGAAPDYRPEKTGFFLFPLERSKNEKIFVVNSAILSIEIEKF